MCNYFKIHPMVKEKKILKGFFYFCLLRQFYSSEWNGLSNFGRGSPKEYSCIIILKSIHGLRQRNHLKLFFFYFQLWQPFCSTERNSLSNFGRGLLKEHSSAILKSVHWFSTRYCLKLFSIYSPGGHYVEQRGTV